MEYIESQLDTYSNYKISLHQTINVFLPLIFTGHPDLYKLHINWDTFHDLQLYSLNCTDYTLAVTHSQTALLQMSRIFDVRMFSEWRHGWESKVAPLSLTQPCYQK